MYAFRHCDEHEIVGLGELSDVGRQNVGEKCSGNMSENMSSGENALHIMWPVTILVSPITMCAASFIGGWSIRKVQADRIAFSFRRQKRRFYFSAEKACWCFDGILFFVQNWCFRT